MFCCFGGSKKRLVKDRTAACKAGSQRLSDLPGAAPLLQHISTRLSSEYGSCRGAFSDDLDGELLQGFSPLHGRDGEVGTSVEDDHGQGGEVGNSSLGTDSTFFQQACQVNGPATRSAALHGNSSELDGYSVSSEDTSNFGPEAPSLGCLNLIGSLSQRVSTMTGSSKEAAASSATAAMGTQYAAKSGKASARKRKHGDKPEPGCSLQKRDMSVSSLDCQQCYENGDGSHYRVRTINYMKTKIKEPNTASIYELLAVDIFKSDKKQKHFAKHMNLSHLPIFKHQDPANNTHYPPLLIINIMLPAYPPSLFGSSDGPGWSIVQYYTLPADFDPATFDNQKALGLLNRLVQNGREADGSQTRDRLKLLSRVVNCEEWKTAAPLSSSEYRLLTSYNEKPLLTRPQHFFYPGHNYLEIDIDVHAYAYVARTAIISFMSRLNSVVWETGFIIQGNSPEELPEQVLASARMYRTNFTHTPPLSHYVSPPPPGHQLEKVLEASGTAERSSNGTELKEGAHK